MSPSRRKTAVVTTIRALTLDDLPAALHVTTTALLLPRATPVEIGRRQAYWDRMRGFAAYDGDRLVGVVRALDLETTVPGGARVSTAGVSGVGVLPTHTRRGLLRAMIEAQLHDERSRGTVLASLRASEAPIYGRFGYGLAGVFADVSVARASGAFLSSAPGGSGAVRMVEREEAAALLPALYERAARWRTGAINRFPAWWEMLLRPFLDADADVSRWIAVHEGPDGPDGYVDYRLDGTRAVHHPDLVATDLFAASIEAHAALWRHLLGIDLAGTIRAERRPLDEPLRWWLVDARAAELAQVSDEQWVRLIDAEAAYRSRSYAAGAEPVVLGLTDTILPANDGCYEITPEGATRSDEAPDLTLGMAEAGATYLGGTSFQDLRDAGRIVEHTPGAAARADRLFAVRPLPWCGTFF